MQERRYLDGDWYGGGIPPNVVLGEQVYVDTSYGLAAMHSEREPAVTLGDASGVYDRASFLVGPRGRVLVGAYVVLNGTFLICNDQITIGDHCLLSWGVVCTDSWLEPGNSSIAARRQMLAAAAASPARLLGPPSAPRPVVLEENVWVGFDSVILPGVRIGRGSIIGCKSIVLEDVPAYTVAAGNPARPLRKLDPDDTPEAREQAFRQHLRPDDRTGNIRHR